MTDITDPMVRALWWKHWEWRNAAIAAECRDPEHGDLRDAALAEVEIAREARAKILRHRWALRLSPINHIAHEVAA